MSRPGIYSSAVLFLFLFAACGGGGGSSSDPTPVEKTYTVGGNVNGTSGPGLVLQNNSGDDLAVSADGPFTFATPIANGSAYNATVKTQPPGQKCAVTNGTGTVSGPVTNVSVTCIELIPSLKWKIQTGGGMSTAAAVGNDGTVYVGTLGGVFYALNPENGTTKWTYPAYKDIDKLNPTDNPGTCKMVTAHSAIQSSPAIGPDGSIYFGTYNQTADSAYGTCSYFYALKPDGTLKWRFLNGWWVNSSPAISADGQTVYVGFENFTDSHLYAFDTADGTPKWGYHISWHVFASPAIGKDGTIYVTSIGDYGALYALNPDGSLKWKFFIGDETYSSPAIGEDGTLYFGSTDTYVYAVNPDGTLKWKYQTDGQIHSSPAVDSDGTIYIGSGSVYDEWPNIVGPWGRYLYAFKPDGTLKWRFDAGSQVNASPAIGNDGTIWVNSYSNKIYLINPDGTLKWSYSGKYVRSSPVISNDGRMYIGSSDGYFYSFGDGPLPSKGPWPMFRHDPMHTGRME